MGVSLSRDFFSSPCLANARHPSPLRGEGKILNLSYSIPFSILTRDLINVIIYLFWMSNSPLHFVERGIKGVRAKKNPLISQRVFF